MPKEKKLQSLRDQTLANLARREHSRFELANKLEHAGHPREDIDSILDEFEAKNWLSDQRFAESYVNDHRAKSGAVKLGYELKLRGVSESIIHDVLMSQNGDELERARAIWQKKFGRLPATPQEKAKQSRFMQSRGFATDVIRQLFYIN